MTKQGRGLALNEVLSSLVQSTPDIEGAVIVSNEGLVVAAEWPIEEQDQSTVGAVATRAYVLCEQTAEKLQRGELDKLVFLSSLGNMIVTRAGEHALCVLLLTSEAKVGLASHAASLTSHEIAGILDH